ncbi:MAG: hypothetical protein COT74_13310 [Bdellovibrionales bacterium CG10_big_fil_rev_8_21_14_0_10_45_34]|nr:MAG: hypothetical protein COT74_13310 [Bdellovibrionales bacterium CG10_big_fil_rev_8_21_14_0_10_45_34]
MRQLHTMKLSGFISKVAKTKSWRYQKTNLQLGVYIEKNEPDLLSIPTKKVDTDDVQDSDKSRVAHCSLQSLKKSIQTEHIGIF